MDNNHHFSETKLRDENIETFLLRWRGKQEGPYSLIIIEGKLAQNQIGLLHEILKDGQWITLREYFAQREALLQAERQMREEEERRMRELAERQDKERKEKYEAELLAKEKRSFAQPEPNSVIHSGQIDTQSRQHINKFQKSSSFRIIGALLLLGGLVITVYFFFLFDPSVSSGMGRVNNIGLMADRQNGIIVGIGLCIFGTLMLLFVSREKI